MCLLLDCFWTCIWLFLNLHLTVFELLFDCFWTCIWLFLDLYLTVFGLVFDCFWTFIWLFLDLYLTVFGLVFDCFWTCIWMFLDLYLNVFGLVFDCFWTCIWLFLDLYLTVFWEVFKELRYKRHHKYVFNGLCGRITKSETPKYYFPRFPSFIAWKLSKEAVKSSELRNRNVRVIVELILKESTIYIYNFVYCKIIYFGRTYH